MNPDVFRIAAPAAMLLLASAAQADTGYRLSTPAHMHIYSGRSAYYRIYPSEDPEPFRCHYAADSTCPGRYDTGFRGDPRDDPEPFRCTYSADAGCPNGGHSGIQ